MEAKLNGNQIILPIGTIISFKMIGKNRKINAVKLINSDEVSKFFAIFGENDVDFEIEVNNSECIYGVGYTLTINEGYYDYYVGPRETWTMETLYSKGRKLHFISQKSEEGKLIVADTAAKHEMSYDEAAAICSRIEFNFEVEKGPEKPVEKPLLFESSRELSLDRSRELSLDRSQKKSQVRSKIMYTDAYEDVALDSLCAKSESLSSQSMFLKSSALGGSGTSKSLSRNISHNSQELSNSGLFSSFGTAVTDSTSSLGLKTLNPEPPPPPNLSYLARPIPTPIPTPVAFEADHDDDRERREAQNAGNNIGEKGVICFGDQSDQIYNTCGAFVKDKNLFIKPFIVEMRISV